MPMKPQRPCKHPGCHRLTHGSRCSLHTRVDVTPMKRQRDRVYRRRSWTDARDAYLDEHPCCVVCGSPERVQVDHIVPHRGDYSLMWDSSNWQTLCHSCHSAKTMRELRGVATQNDTVHSAPRVSGSEGGALRD